MAYKKLKYWFDKDLALLLTDKIQEHYSEFDATSFMTEIADGTPKLELKDDNSKFVQKSVANNLNDILKDNYETGIITIKKWSKGATTNRQWILKHALRNQAKTGNEKAKRILDNLKN